MSTADNVLRALHGLESHGPGKYTAFNPYNAPGQSRAKNLQLDITDGEHGVFTLHSAQGIEKRSGSLYELAEIVGATVERAVRILPKERTYRDLADYAEKHGVPAAAYEAAGWKMVTYTNRPALQFETQTGRRWRFLDTTGPRFLNKGKDGNSYKTCWYGLKNAPALLKSSGIPLVLCNGEPSVVAAQYHGVPAVCITTSGEKGIPAELLPTIADTVSEGARVIVALDCDSKGRDTAAKLVHQLDGLGYAVHAVDLGLDEGDDLADFCKLHTTESAAKLAALPPMEFRKAAPDTPLDGYVPEQRPMPTVEVKQSNALEELNKTLGKLRAEHRSESKEARNATLAQARALIDQIEQADGQSLLISGEDVANEAVRKFMERKARKGALSGLPTGFKILDKLIDGFNPGVNVFLGAPGMGKSWTVTSITGNLARRGYRGLAITTEMIPDVWQNRVAAYISGVETNLIKHCENMTPAQDAAYVDALNLIEKQLSFVRGVRPTPAALRATVLDAKMKGDIHFVVIDSASRLVGTGDNVSQETAALQNSLQELVLETELPFIVTGQVRNRDIANRAMKMPSINDGFGSSAWEFNADVLIGLYNHTYYVKNFHVDEDPEFPEGTVAMRVLKNREGESVADQIMKVSFIGGRGVFELEERRAPPFRVYSREEDEDGAIA
jgi:replicative DNA helicase